MRTVRRTLRVTGTGSTVSDFMASDRYGRGLTPRKCGLTLFDEGCGPLDPVVGGEQTGEKLRLQSQPGDLNKSNQPPIPCSRAARARDRAEPRYGITSKS